MFDTSRVRSVITIATAILAIPAHDATARSPSTGQGSLLAPTFSLQHDVLRPGADVTLLACVTNQNRHSTRSMTPGVSFRFDITDGFLGACGDITAFPVGVSPVASDFTCDAQPGRLTITYLGPSIAWPLGAGVCTEVQYLVGDQSSTVLTSQSGAHRGAWIGADPPAILLNVGSSLETAGPPGPPGPEGPEGPAGPAGAGAAGARVMAVSTGSLFAYACEPPLLVPGLEASVTVSAGSSLEIHVEAAPYYLHACGIIPFQMSPGLLDLEVDGITVASSYVLGHADHLGGAVGIWPVDADIAWLTPALSAGTHRVRVLLRSTDPDCVNPWTTRCVGSAGSDELQARLLVVELRN